MVVYRPQKIKGKKTAFAVITASKCAGVEVLLDQLHPSQPRLSIYRNGVYYIYGITAFNHLPYYGKKIVRG
jgi:RNA 3'-terminal phosphate cyclase